MLTYVVGIIAVKISASFTNMESEKDTTATKISRKGKQSERQEVIESMIACLHSIFSSWLPMFN